MEKKQKINFTGDVTIREAFVYSVLYTGVFYRNVWRAVNRAAHRLPWVFVIVAVAVSTLTSYVCIAKARAERDSCSKKLVHAMQQLESYRAVYGDGKEARP